MSVAVQWLLTYLLHSTVLLGGAGLLGLLLRGRGLAVQDAALRAALLGGLLTASLQVGLGVDPLGGTVRINIPSPPARVAAAPSPDGWIAGPLPEVLEEVRRRGHAMGASAPSAPWRVVLVTGWALVALVGLVRLGVGSARLRRLLHPRAPVADGPLEAGAAALSLALGLKRPVPLRAAPRLDVPLATGVLRPAVYLPVRVVEELAADARLALCAHELAHVARRDPLWLLVARVCEALVPVQPLHAWACRRQRHLAELLSDDLAVSVTARPQKLARSLVDVASWTRGEPAFPPGVASGALSTRSRLGHRVERLMDPLHSPRRPPRFLLPLAVATVAATTFLTPAVSGDAPGRGEEKETTPSARSEDARRELQELTERIRARAEARAPEMDELGARLESRGDARSHADAEATVEDARARLSAVRDVLREAVRGARQTSEEHRALAEAARALAESVRPTAAELAELRHLSREVAASREDADRDLLELEHELGREGARELREILTALGDSLRLTRESMPDLHDLMDTAREAAREAERELSRTVERRPRRLHDAEDPPPLAPGPPLAPHPPVAPPLAPEALVAPAPTVVPAPAPAPVPQAAPAPRAAPAPKAAPAPRAGPEARPAPEAPATPVAPPPPPEDPGRL